MKNKKKSLFKILAGVIGIALIAGILFIANAFVGNPISAMIANKAIDQYVDENYSFLDLEVGKASYNFKLGCYMAFAKSRTSVDTKFAIYYRDGKVQRDDYKSNVLEMSNTLRRLSDEYSTIVKNIVSKELGYKNRSTVVMYDKAVYKNAAYGNYNHVLELDMKFDKALPMDTEVIIRLDDLRDNSLESIAKILIKAHRTFVNNDCNFKKYSLSSEVDGVYINVDGVTPSHIESGELISLLNKAKDSDSVEGIGVFIKGENK